MERSPSPPLTARVVVRPSHLCNSRQTSGSVEDEEWIRTSGQQQGLCSTTRSASTRPSGPLAAHPLNVSPALPWKLRSSAAAGGPTPIPAPDFHWEVTMSEQGSEPSSPTQGRGSATASRHTRWSDQQQQQQQQQSFSSSSSKQQQLPTHCLRNSSGSRTSATRRSSVLGPDPNDCVDLREERKVMVPWADDDDEEEPQEMLVAPLPHVRYQRPQQQQQQQQRLPSVADDLDALVNADTVDRCRSDSRGQVLLVEKYCDGDSNDDGGRRSKTHSGGAQRREENFRASSSCGEAALPATRSASIRVPADLLGDRNENEAGSTSTASSHSTAYATAEFAMEYDYYPDSPCNHAAQEAEGDGERTPRRSGPAAATKKQARASASPSPSVPRWAHSLTEETPFTPFTFHPPCPPAAAAGACDGTTAVTECQRDGALLSLRERLTATPQRLTVQEVVAAVLAAPPSVGVKAEAELHGPLDEPPPRRPAESTLLYGKQEAALSVPQLQQAEASQLQQHIARVRARLSHVDLVMLRCDAVLESRQAELRAVEERLEELTQQANSHKTRAAMARKETRRLRDRQHTKEELQLLQDMLVDKENRLAVAQSQLLALKRLRRQLDLLHTASAEKSVLQDSRSHEHRSAPSTPSVDGAPPRDQSHSERQPEASADVAVPPGEPAALPPARGRGVPFPPTPPHLPKPHAASPTPTPVATDTSRTAVAQQPPEVQPCEDAGKEEEAEEEEEEGGVSGAGARRTSSPAAASASSSASSLASLDTCDIMDDFLEELLMEVDGLAKVCIQLPSPPPAMSYCNRPALKATARGNGAQGGGTGGHAPRRGRATYSALNRRLNDGNNGFFSFFGGATEAHLNSKPLSTFLANVDRLARSSWELEEEVQLRARELATDVEEEELRSRLMIEYGLINKGEGGESRGPADLLLSPVNPLQPSRTEEAKEALQLSEEADPLAATTASADRTTRQLFLSSPEHGRRSRGSAGGASANVNGGLLSPVSGALTSPLLRRPTSLPLLLPTLVYAFPRVAAVSQHLNTEQQQIQAEYAATIAAARLQRRDLTARLREVFREQVAPALQRRIDALREQQVALAQQLGALGVKEVTITWEEEEPATLDGDALLQLMDEATAAGRRQWLGGPRRRGGQRSRSHISACSVAREEDSGAGEEATSSRGASALRVDGDAFRHRGLPSESCAAIAALDVYRRTLRVVCNEGSAEEQQEKAVARTTTPASPRSGRVSGAAPPQPHHHHQSHSSHHTQRSARSARRRASAGSGRRSGAVSAAAAAGASASHQRQSVAGHEQSLFSAARLTATNKSCSALQLYTHAPTPQLLRTAQRRGEADGAEETGAAFAKTSNAKPVRIALVAAPALRCSGGTPRVSGAPGASTTTRSSTLSGRVSGGRPAPPSPRRRTSSQPVSPRPPSTRAEAPLPPLSVPRIVDTRVRLPAEGATPPGGASATPIAAAAGLWSPFAQTRDALADGAVHVAVIFGGAEAHRREVAQARRSAYQRAFWQLREELARVDEDIFQLRTHHTDLCAVQQQTEAAQQQKMEEAEAKVRKCRAFYKTLKRENREWQDICDELQRVIREGE